MYITLVRILSTSNYMVQKNEEIVFMLSKAQLTHGTSVTTHTLDSFFSKHIETGKVFCLNRNIMCFPVQCSKKRVAYKEPSRDALITEIDQLLLHNHLYTAIVLRYLIAGTF